MMNKRSLYLIFFSLIVILFVSISVYFSISWQVWLFVSLSTIPAFVYFFVIALSNSEACKINESVEETDLLIIKILVRIEQLYKYTGQIWGFIIFGILLAGAIIIECLTWLFFQRALINEDILVFLTFSTAFFGLCFAYKNMIFYAKNHIKYRKWDDVQINKKKNFFLSLLFILFIFPMPVLTAIGSLEQALIATRQETTLGFIFELIKIIPFFKFLFYN